MQFTLSIHNQLGKNARIDTGLEHFLRFIQQLGAAMLVTLCCLELGVRGKPVDLLELRVAATGELVPRASSSSAWASCLCWTQSIPRTIWTMAAPKYALRLGCC